MPPRRAGGAPAAPRAADGPGARGARPHSARSGGHSWFVVHRKFDLFELYRSTCVEGTLVLEYGIVMVSV